MLSFSTERARLLPAYLALHQNTPLPRAHVAEIFWPDRQSGAARHSLRTELNRLKQAIGDSDDAPIVRATRTHVEFVTSGEVTVDAHRFQAHIDAARSHPHDQLSRCTQCIEHLQQATTIYRGELLADADLNIGEDFEDWLTQARRRFEQDMLWAFDNLVAARIETGQPQEAALLAQKQTGFVPWYELAHRNLMRALTVSGQRTAALRQFDVLVQILAEQLATEPSPETMALYRQISTNATPSSIEKTENPYQGLEAFGVADASLFFGREQATSRLYELMQNRPFIALIGPSGSGKSSVVHAGLIPQLDESWAVISFRPGADPFRNLAEATSKGSEDSTILDQWTTFQQWTQDQQASFIIERTAAVAGTTAGADERRNCLLVVDQFEEVFTQCHDAQQRLDFSDLLLAVAQLPTVTCRVLIALRADFMAQALSHAPLANALQNGALMLGAMTREELRRAIERPALLQGVTFEPGLVDRLLDDVSSEPGNLPLLQFTLTLLWQEQKDGWLTHAAYDDLERVVGALTHYASGVYARLQPEQQHQAQRIFLQLIQPGQGAMTTTITATYVEIGQEDWRLVQHLADRRLVVTNRGAGGEDTVEIVHEALITEWKLLQNWMEQDREFRIWQQRVRVSLGQWQRSAEDQGALLRGGPLAEAERWMQERGEELSAPLRNFIQAGIDYRQRRLAEQEERQRRELENAQALAQAESQRAESEARSSQRLRWLTAGLGVALALALVAALFAIQSRRDVVTERNRAKEDARIALSRQLSAQSMRSAESQIDLALLLGLTATEINLPDEDRTELMTELALPPLLKTMRQDADAPVYDLAYSVDGNALFVRDEKGSVWAWDLTQPSAPPTPLIFQDADIREVMFTVQGDRMAVNRVKSVEIWNLITREPIATVNDHDQDIISLNFSADGRYLITADAETMLIRDGVTGEVVKPALPSDPRAIISYDGTTFVRVDIVQEGPDKGLQ
ncbi:MAG: hypothetical protein KDD84_22700, partial [Caldilineaceae bacterium]|nr:hypothetical protein [Caldilineaceae bacterium]